MQLLALAAPCKLHVSDLAVMVQRKPCTELQLLCPGAHRLGGLAAAIGDDLDVGGINTYHHHQALGVQRQVAHVFV